MKLNGSNSVAYKPASQAVAQSAYSEMQMDFKTTQTNTFLMFFGNQSSSSVSKLYLIVSNLLFYYLFIVLLCCGCEELAVM